MVPQAGQVSDENLPAFICTFQQGQGQLFGLGVCMFPFEDLDAGIIQIPWKLYQCFKVRCILDNQILFLLKVV